MDYIPTTPPINNSMPEYVLVDDVTHKPVPKRGPQIITDKKGNKVNVPWPPKASCKKCYGRGYIGHNALTDELMPCRKCYPFDKLPTR